uniref:Uncharacterized protein n=1 Tax=Ciona savignyi TaxID=51511 RepID=H2Y484_CIOSA
MNASFPDTNQLVSFDGLSATVFPTLNISSSTSVLSDISGLNNGTKENLCEPIKS